MQVAQTRPRRKAGAHVLYAVEADYDDTDGLRISKEFECRMGVVAIKDQQAELPWVRQFLSCRWVEHLLQPESS